MFARHLTIGAGDRRNQSLQAVYNPLMAHCDQSTDHDAYNNFSSLEDVTQGFAK